MGSTFMQRVARNESSNLLQALTNQQLGHGLRRNNERDFRRHLLASKFAQDQPKDRVKNQWSSFDLKNSRYKKAKVSCIWEWIWVSYPDPNSAGRLYKHEFLQLESLGSAKEQIFIGKSTLGPVKQKELVTYRKSMSTTPKRIIVTLTLAGCITCTEIVSSVLIAKDYQRILRGVDPTTKFTECSMDEQRDFLIVLEENSGGGTRAIHLLDVDDLTSKIKINIVGPLLCFEIFNGLVCLNEKETVDVCSVYELCEGVGVPVEGVDVYTVQDYPNVLARLPVSATCWQLEFMDSFWPPLYIFMCKSSKGLFFKIHDFRLDHPILEIPCMTGATLTSFNGCSRALLLKGHRHALYKLDDIGTNAEPHFQISEEEPFNNPLPIVAEPAPEAVRRSSRVRRPIPREPEPTNVYDVEFSPWLGMFIALVQDDESIKVNFYEKRTLEYSSGINLPAICFPRQLHDDSIKVATCEVDSEYLTVHLNLGGRDDIIYYISIVARNLIPA